MASAQTSSETPDTDQESDGLAPSPPHRWYSDADNSAADCTDSPILESASSNSLLPLYRSRLEKKNGGRLELNASANRSPSQSPETQLAGKDSNGTQLLPVGDPGSDVDLEKGGNSVQIKQADGEEEEDEEEGEEEEEEEQRECRVCHMSVQSMAGEAIELGCECKEDLAIAHRHCAEAWFKIKGNRTCEICGSTAQNVVGIEDAEFMDQWNAVEASAPASNEPRRCWHSQPLCNLLLICMALAFILSWLFRVSVF